MKLSLRLLLFFMSCFSGFVTAQPIEAEFDKFDQIYKHELGSTRGCNKPDINIFRVCSDVLRNDGNAPFILHHNKVTSKVVVLFHGLSDSPFYLKSIAHALHQQGHNVVVALLPGHGKKNADLDMQDYELSQRWREHVATMIDLSHSLGEKMYVGGFSTGGALATEYLLLNPDSAQALLLFSGALALQPNIETLTKVWGIQWVMKLIDGEYQSEGPNPYKYPSVARFAAGELMEVINSVRKLIQQNKPKLAIFAAHSEADTTIPIIGVRNLLADNVGVSKLFTMDKTLNICHADVVINQQQAQAMSSDTSATDLGNSCNGPRANPQHAEMLKAMLTFVVTH